MKGRKVRMIETQRVWQPPEVTAEQQRRRRSMEARQRRRRQYSNPSSFHRSMVQVMMTSLFTCVCVCVSTVSNECVSEYERGTVVPPFVTVRLPLLSSTTRTPHTCILHSLTHTHATTRLDTTYTLTAHNEHTTHTDDDTSTSVTSSLTQPGPL